MAEAIASGVDLEEVLVTPAWAAGGQGAALLRALRCPVTEVAPDLLAELADADTPQGALAVARLPRPPVAALPRVAGGVYLYLDGVQDPGNLGAIARVAEAAGATGYVVAGQSADPFGWKALRGSMGSVLRLPTVHDGDATTVAGVLRAHRLHCLAAAPAGAVSFEAVDWRGPIACFVGSEGSGLPAELMAMADRRVRIPMAEPVESLNVAVSAGLLLYEARRQRTRPATAASSG